MNINFHYFAVKAIAIFAGYNNDEAQTLAEFSQFVDDCDLYTPKMAVPMVDPKLKDVQLIKPVTTGFGDSIDYALLSTESSQKDTVVPFHFIPKVPLTQVPDGKRYRTVPAEIGDGSLISLLMQYAREMYRKNRGAFKSLMRIGVLLHIFADTYAHQRFSGFQGWENHTFFRHAYRIDGDDENVFSEFDSFVPNCVLPAIGHGEMGTVPDETYLEFFMYQYETDMRFKPNPEYVKYKRTNKDEFTRAARQIMMYLRQCRGDPPIPEEREWTNFVTKLHLGFNQGRKSYRVDIDDIPALCEYWGRIFPEVRFEYDKNKVLGNGSSPDYVDTWICDIPKVKDYNHIAAQIRDIVQGSLAVVGFIEGAGDPEGQIPNGSPVDSPIRKGNPLPDGVNRYPMDAANKNSRA